MKSRSVSNLSFTTAFFCLFLWAGVVQGRDGWTIEFTSDSTPILRHDGEPMLRMSYLFITGPDGRWEGMDLNIEPSEGGGYDFYGSVRRMPVVVRGHVSLERGAVLRYDFRMEIQEPLPESPGLAVDFRLTPAPTSMPRPPMPSLMGKKGWQWNVGPGGLTVSGEGDFGDVIFLNPERDSVRLTFSEAGLQAGTEEYTLLVKLPRGAKLAVPPSARYDSADDKSKWFSGALDPEKSPVNLRGMNDSVAGVHGFVRASGDELLFEDDTVAKFWGTTVSSSAIFSDKEKIDIHAARIAALGFNLVRIRLHDAPWVHPNIFGPKNKNNTLDIDEECRDKLDYWIAALKKNGVYTWLDIHSWRVLKAGDYESEKYGDIPGADEIRLQESELRGFCYVNPTIKKMMKDFQRQLIDHVNPYTGKAYKDEPAIAVVMISNRNDITEEKRYIIQDQPEGSYHFAVAVKGFMDFCKKVNFPLQKIMEPEGERMRILFMNELEHRFFSDMSGQLKQLGIRIPVVFTDLPGGGSLFNLPAAAEGDIVAVWIRAEAEPLSVNPRYEPSFVYSLSAHSVPGKPSAISSWYMGPNQVDRSLFPLYIAAIASLQGIDIVIHEKYSSGDFSGVLDKAADWNEYYDPACLALMPAAGLAFRGGDIKEGRRVNALALDPRVFFGEPVNAASSAAIRTTAETARTVTAIPDARELDWDKAYRPPRGAKRITDFKTDLISGRGTSLKSDTGEIIHDFAEGWMLINTPNCQAAFGWIGGEKLKTRDLRFMVETKKAAVCLVSLDGKPLRKSSRILLTVAARALPADAGGLPYLSEPVIGEIKLKASPDLVLYPLSPEGEKTAALNVEYKAGTYRIKFSGQFSTHWLVMEKSEQK